MTQEDLKNNSKLQEFVQILLTWQNKINLVSRFSLTNLWNRHIIDSAQVATYIKSGKHKILDLGSGAGFPGLVLAILDQSDNEYYLVDSNHKKTVFLNTVKTQLGLSNVNVLNIRIEELLKLLDFKNNCEYIISRGLTQLGTLISYTQSLLSDQGRAIFLKGANWESELGSLNYNDLLSSYKVEILPSLTHKEGRVILVELKNKRG